MTTLWTFGAALAGLTAVVTTDRHLGASGYMAAAAALMVLAFFTARGHRLITTIGLVICALQPLAVIATAWELTHRISHAQTEKLQALGVSPRLGIAVNLCFSLCVSALAAWAYQRRRSRRPR